MNCNFCEKSFVIFLRLTVLTKGFFTLSIDSENFEVKNFFWLETFSNFIHFKHIFAKSIKWTMKLRIQFTSESLIFNVPSNTRKRGYRMVRKK